MNDVILNSMREYIDVNCSQCGGDCADVCVESGLPSYGGLSTWQEHLDEIRARVPLLRAQRFQREQLHVLIDKADEVGAWLYSTDKRPYRPVARWDEPPRPKFHEARDLIEAHIRCWYSPQRLRELLKQDHGEDFYSFRWHLRNPKDGAKEVRSIVDAINKALEDFEQAASCPTTLQ